MTERLMVLKPESKCILFVLQSLLISRVAAAVSPGVHTGSDPVTRRNVESPIGQPRVCDMKVTDSTITLAGRGNPSVGCTQAQPPFVGSRENRRASRQRQAKGLLHKGVAT